MPHSKGKAFAAILLPEEHKDAELSQQAIAEVCDLNKATVVHAIDRLEQFKLVIRKPNKSDRRLNEICFTERGRKEADRFVNDVFRWESDLVFRGFSTGDSRMLRELLLERRLFQGPEDTGGWGH